MKDVYEKAARAVQPTGWVPLGRWRGDALCAKNKQRQQRDAGISPLRRAKSHTASVEMTASWG